MFKGFIKKPHRSAVSAHVVGAHPSIQANNVMSTFKKGRLCFNIHLLFCQTHLSEGSALPVL